MRISIPKVLTAVCVMCLFVYGALVGTMWFMQRELLFTFQHRGMVFESLNLSGAKQQWLQTPDGVKLETFYLPPRVGRPVVIYLHGKGTSLAREAGTLRILAEQDLGFLGVSYRGSGNSEGEATEKGLVTDALAAHDWLRQQGFAENRIMVLGQSLGTGVAVQLAAQRPVAAVALAAPYTSVVDVAASHYWYLPVRLLLQDTFDSAAFISKVKAPLLIVHGSSDRTIPASFGETLFALANNPKKMEVILGAGHRVINDRYTILAFAAFFDSVYAKTLAAR